MPRAEGTGMDGWWQIHYAQGKYQPKCPCGWYGRRGSRKEAEKAAIAHQAECRWLDDEYDALDAEGSWE